MSEKISVLTGASGHVGYALLKKLCSNCNFTYKKAADELGYAPMSAEQSFTDMVAWIKANEKK